MENIAIYRKIYNHLLEKINGGAFTPGVALPSEKQLCLQYSCSRITAQKALSLLSEQGYVVRRPGAGTFLSETLRTAEAEHARAKRLGLIIDVLSDGVNSPICLAAADCARKLGYALFLQISADDPEAEREAIVNLKSIGVVGMIIMPTMSKYFSSELMQAVIDGYKIVTLNRELTGLPTSLVGTDHLGVMNGLVGHLYKNGRRNLAYITDVYHHSSAMKKRARAFLDEMELRGKLNPPVCRLTDPSAESAELRDFFVEHPQIDGIISHNAEVALLVRRVLDDIGRKTPEDIALACMDDPLPNFQGHEFTFAVQPGTEIGCKAVELIVRQIETNSTEVERIYIPAKLVGAKIPLKNMG